MHSFYNCNSLPIKQKNWSLLKNVCISSIVTSAYCECDSWTLVARRQYLHVVMSSDKYFKEDILLPKMVFFILRNMLIMFILTHYIV